MLKMRDVYIQNTALGDPATLDKQLEENAQQLDKLKQELHKFEVKIRGSKQLHNLFIDTQVCRKTKQLSISLY